MFFELRLVPQRTFYCEYHQKIQLAIDSDDEQVFLFRQHIPHRFPRWILGAAATIGGVWRQGGCSMHSPMPMSRGHVIL